MVDKVFGRLKVIALASQPARGHARWFCVCDCGDIVIVDGVHLRRNKIQSCGCILTEILTARNAALAKHGMYGTPTYRSWVAMKSRCKAAHRKYYGGRGVTVCSRWKRFENFLEDMGERPTLKHTIDRINGNGHYTKSNCKWSTKKEQSSHLMPRGTYKIKVPPLID